jgi:hypothetical protein
LFASFSDSGFFVLCTMARCKNVRGSSSAPPRDDEGDKGDSPPRIIEVARGKRKILTRNKRSREEREAEEVLAVSQAADRAEKGGRGSGILIGDSHTRIPLSDRVLGTKTTEETEAQAEEPQEQEQQSSPLRHSRRTTCSQTTPAAALERPRRGVV